MSKEVRRNMQLPDENIFPQELKDRLNGKIWIGPDLITPLHTVIPERSMKKVLVVLPQIPPPLQGLGLENLRFVQAMTRSRDAQIGLIAHKDSGKMIKVTWEDHKGLQAYIPVENYSPRPIVIPKDKSILRPYILETNHKINGRKLINLIDTKDIKIEGDQGNEWKYTFSSLEDEQLENPSGIALTLDPKFVKTIPSFPNTPITISHDSGIDYRSEIDRILVDAERVNHDLFWVGETVCKIALSNRVTGIIDTPEHRNSLLIVGGETPWWKIRVEMLSPTSEEKRPKEIELKFVETFA